VVRYRVYGRYATGIPYSGGVTGEPITHPDYTPYSLGTDRRDVGGVVLNKEVQSGIYGRLPELGFLDKLATQRGLQEQTFTVVGYGIQEILPRPQDVWVRYRGTVSLIDLRSAISDSYFYSIHPSAWQVTYPKSNVRFTEF
jgi:hypothetical protein